MTRRPGLETLSVMVAIMAAMRMLMMMPMVLGAWADQYGMDEQQLGTLASLEMAGMAVAIFSTAYWIAHVNLRLTFGLCLALMLAGDFLSFHLENAQQLMILRPLLAVAAGVITGAVYVYLGRQDNPSKLFGFVIALQMGYPALGFYLAPILMAQYGYTGLLATLWFALLVGILFVPFLPRERLQADTSVDDTALLSREMIFPGMFLLASFLYYFTSGGIWPLVERIGLQEGHGIGDIGNAMSLGLLAGLAGALAVTIWERLLTPLGALSLLLLLANTGLWLLLDSDTYWAFISTNLLFNLAWGAVPAILFGLIASQTQSAKVLSSISAFQLLGLVFGPLLLSQLVVESDFAPLLIAGIGLYLAIIAISAVGVVGGKNRRNSQDSAITGRG